MNNKKAVFFCSAVKEIEPEYNQAARDIVRAACEAGYGIVSGTTIKGTMKVVCDTAAECGAEISGAIPSFMKGLEYPGADLVWTDTMAERKEKMREGTSLAVALPGGIGTLDELAETLCLAKMGLYKGRIIVCNIKGYYDNFKRLLEDFVRANMMPAETLDLVSFVATVEEFKKLI